MKLFLLLAVLISSMSSFAQTKIISVDAFEMSYVGGLSFKHIDGKDDDRDETTFRFNINYAQSWADYYGLMWKAQVYWNRNDIDYGNNDSLASEWGAAGGFLYNFQADDIKNSFMASALVGVERGTYEFPGGDDEAGFNLLFTVEGGKRFDLGSYAVANISYAPTISLQFKRYGGDVREELFKSSRDIRFNFLKFDILF